MSDRVWLAVLALLVVVFVLGLRFPAGSWTFVVLACAGVAGLFALASERQSRGR